MKRKNLFLTCHRDWTSEIEINVLLFKSHLFITPWRILNKQYKYNELKIITPIWNDEFELPDGSYIVVDIKVYIKYIIKKHKTLTTIPPIDVSINWICNRLAFKIEDEYMQELQMPETIQLFGSKIKLIGKTKTGEKVPSLEVVEVLLIQCNLVANQFDSNPQPLSS